MIHVLPALFTVSVLLVKVITKNKLQNYNSALNKIVGESASVDISMTRIQNKLLSSVCLLAFVCNLTVSSGRVLSCWVGFDF